MPHMSHNIRTLSRQRGSALILSLVFLVIMTLIAVSAMRDTTLQERMAGNLRDRSLAFQAAEASLRDGEVWLLSPAGRLAAGVLVDEIADPATWDGTAPAPTQAASLGFIDGGLHSANPEFHVSPARVARASGGSLDISAPGQLITSSHDVTSRGIGGTDTSVVVLQTTVVIE